MKIEQEIMEMFDKKFNMNVGWGIENSAGEYGLNVQGWEEIKSFISQIITLVRKREREEMVELIEYATGEMKTSETDKIIKLLKQNER